MLTLANAWGKKKKNHSKVKEKLDWHLLSSWSKGSPASLLALGKALCAKIILLLPRFAVGFMHAEGHCLYFSINFSSSIFYDSSKNTMQWHTPWLQAVPVLTVMGKAPSSIVPRFSFLLVMYTKIYPSSVTENTRPPFSSLQFYEHKTTTKWTRLNTQTASTSRLNVARQRATAEMLLPSVGSITLGWGLTVEDTAVVVGRAVKLAFVAALPHISGSTALLVTRLFLSLSLKSRINQIQKPEDVYPKW